MAVELRMPSFGESVTEALVSRWLKQEGDWVETDEPVVVLETDKVTSEVPSPTRGQLQRIVKAEGQTVVVGEVIAVIDETAQRTAAPAKVEPPAKPVLAAVVAARASEAGLVASAVPATPKVEPSAPGKPAVPAPASEEGLAPAQPDLAALVSARASEAGRFAPSIARHEDVVPMSPLRKTIAERLVKAQQSAALLTTFNEIDMSAVIELRGRARPLFEEKYGVKLGFMSFFVKAAIDGLKLVPQVNARVDGEAVVYRNYYDVAVAVGGGRGLVTPVLRNADQLSFAEVEIAIADFARRAKDNRLTLDELTGGTFTISNGGVYGSMLSTPIVNHPQSGILGLHTIQDRPVAREGQVVIRPMMFVALTYDHRIIDGREAVTFLRRVKDCIEDPSRILLEV